MTVLPVAIMVGIFGLSFGVLAGTADMPGWQAVLMSATVFAGSAQFAGVSVLADGGGVAAAVLSGALLNSRYIATGAATAPWLPGGRWRRMLLSQLVVDESFALGVAAGEPGRPDRRTLLLSGAALWVAWVGGTTIGTVVGDALGDPRELGLDVVFPLFFLYLLWSVVARDRALVRPAVAGGAVALALVPFTPDGVPLAAAAVVGLVLSP